MMPENWLPVTNLSPLSPWGSVSFLTHQQGKEYNQALTLEAAKPFLPGGLHYAEFLAANNPDDVEKLVELHWQSLAASPDYENAVTQIMLMFIAPTAELMALLFQDAYIPSWWEGVGLSTAQFDLLRDPATWIRWVQHALLLASEQKIGGGQHATFRQGLVFTPILNSRTPLTKPKAARTHTGDPKVASLPSVGRASMLATDEIERDRALYFVHTITFILPISLVAIAGRRLSTGMIGAVSAAKSGTQFTVKALGCDNSPTTAFSGEVTTRLGSSDPVRTASLEVAQRCARGRFVGQHRMDQLSVPDLSRPASARANLILVHKVDALDLAGGADWLRRLREALQVAAETSGHPWAPPWLLSPSKRSVTSWLIRLRFDEHGRPSAEPTHEMYIQWAAAGAYRAELAGIQKAISDLRKVSEQPGSRTTGSRLAPSWQGSLAAQNTDHVADLNNGWQRYPWGTGWTDREDGDGTGWHRSR
jgi:hypothetical protein